MSSCLYSKIGKANPTPNLYAGRYHLRKELGKGQYGMVFLARDMQVGLEQMARRKKVAIKIVKEIEGDDDEIETEIFEKMYLRQRDAPLKCKGLPVVKDHGNLPEKREKYFVMERLGVSLVDIIKKTHLRFSYQQIIALGCQLLTALENFHDLGYVHCDIKPDNILFGLNKQKKILKQRLSIFNKKQEEQKGE